MRDLQWMPTYTAFFIDGEERGRITDNVRSSVNFVASAMLIQAS